MKKMFGYEIEKIVKCTTCGRKTLLTLGAVGAEGAECHNCGNYILWYQYHRLIDKNYTYF